MVEITNTLKIIVVCLAGLGLFHLILGILQLFDKSFLLIGNVLLLSVLIAFIGLLGTFKFFFQAHKEKARYAFLGGIIIIVLDSWPLIGLCMETYGFIVLFSGYFPHAKDIIWSYLDYLPWIQKIIKWLESLVSAVVVIFLLIFVRETIIKGTYRR